MDLDGLISEVEAQVGLDTRGLLDESLCQRKIDLERLRNLVAVIDSITVADLEERKATDTLFGSTTATWIAHVAKVPAGVARRQVKIATKLRQLLPQVHAAWASGAINEEHVRVFHQAANPRIRDEIAALQRELIALAEQYSFHHWRQVMANLVAELDQDGAFDPDAETERNTAHFAETLDGSCSLAARFDRVAFATIRHLVDAKADELFRHHAQRAKTAEGDLPIPSRPTLRALAIFELIHDGAAATAGTTVTDATLVLTPEMAGRSEASSTSDAPVTGPEPEDDQPAPTPTSGLAQVGGWRAWTLDGLLLPGSSPELAARLCDARVQRLVLDADGLPLAMGRAVRLFDAHQRRAVAIRDGGCVMPGCTQPASATQLHHVREYHRDHGPTDVTNGAGLCPRDHGVPHRAGWDMFITADQWTWFRTPTGRTFWGQRHGHQRTGLTPDHPEYVPRPAEGVAARPPPTSGDTPRPPSRSEAPARLVPRGASPEVHRPALGRDPDTTADRARDRCTTCVVSHARRDLTALATPTAIRDAIRTIARRTGQSDVVRVQRQTDAD